jgi:hypothetical protein
MWIDVQIMTREKTMRAKGDARTGEHMVRERKSGKELFSYLDFPKVGDREKIAETMLMAVEFLKYQGEVAYEISKKQAIAITSTASTIGIGWSAFFFGIAQESWLTTSIGMMMVFFATFLLGYWTPKVVDKARKSLDDLGAAKFYDRWLSDSAKSGGAEESQ